MHELWKTCEDNPDGGTALETDDADQGSPG